MHQVEFLEVELLFNVEELANLWVCICVCVCVCVCVICAVYGVLVFFYFINTMG